MSSFILKIIALLTMTIDHIGVFIFPGQIGFRIIGRVAFILFAFLLTEGFIYTSNRFNYLKRLVVMAIICQLGVLLPQISYPGNIFFTLSFGLYGLMLLEEQRYFRYLLLVVLSYFVPIDYGSYGVMLIGIFYLFKKYQLNYGWQLIIFTLLNYYGIHFLNFSNITYFSVVALVLTWMYNGKRGYNNQVLNLLFYWYYPIHLLIINLISYFLK